MPKVGRIGLEDLYVGFSTFTRISRLKPDELITLNMINAGNIYYSGGVYASTIEGALNLIDTSGIDPQKMGRGGGTIGSGYRIDCGTWAGSGATYGVSTGLSSIVNCVASVRNLSGMDEVSFGVNWSSSWHCVDLARSSSGTVAWQAIGY